MNAKIAGAFLLCCLLLIACGAQDKPSEESIYSSNPPRQIGGGRPAQVILPDDYTIGKRYPLVMILHPYRLNAGIFDKVWGLSKRVTEDQFVLVLPDGLKDEEGNRFWNATPECCNFHESTVNDVSYLRALIEEATRTYAIEKGNVALFGHSNGGYMSYRMACEAPDLIDRIVVLAGSVFLDENDCVGTRPVSVIHIHGTVDDRITYEPYTRPETANTLPASTVGAVASIERWREKAGCEKIPVESSADLTELAGSETVIQTWENCAENRTIELWTGNGEDHLYLDVNHAFRERLVNFLVGNASANQQ